MSAPSTSKSRISRPEELIHLFYPLMAFLACVCGHFYWNYLLELNTQKPSSWLGPEFIYASFYTAVLANITATLFFNSLILRSLSFFGGLGMYLCLSYHEIEGMWVLWPSLSFALIFMPGKAQLQWEHFHRLSLVIFSVVSGITLVSLLKSLGDFDIFFHSLSYRSHWLLENEAHQSFLLSSFQALGFIWPLLSLIFVAFFLGLPLVLRFRKLSALALFLGLIYPLLVFRIFQYREMAWSLLVLPILLVLSFVESSPQKEQIRDKLREDSAP